MITLCTTCLRIVFCVRTWRNYCIKCIYIWHVHRNFQTILRKEKKNHFTSNKCMNMSIFPSPLNKATYYACAYYATYWFFLLIFKNFLYIMGIYPLSVMHDGTNIFSGLLLIPYLHLYFDMQKCFFMASEFNALNRKSSSFPRVKEKKCTLYLLML